MKTCSTPGCKNLAAYRTRSKPAYCLECIDRITGEFDFVRVIMGSTSSTAKKESLLVCSVVTR